MRLVYFLRARLRAGAKLDWSPSMVERSLLGLAATVADVQLGMDTRASIERRIQDLRDAVANLSANPRINRGLRLLPEYPEALQVLANVMKEVEALGASPTMSTLAAFRRDVRAAAAQVHIFAADSQRLEARIRETRNPELTGNR